jgi:hypothetical protein
MIQHKDFFNLLQYEIEKVGIVLQGKNLFCMFFDPIMSSLKTGEVAFGIMGFFHFCLNYAADQGMSFHYNSVEKRKKENLMKLSISKP